jgi:hypothetical protein
VRVLTLHIQAWLRPEGKAVDPYVV